MLLAGTVDALRAPLDARRITLYTDIDPENPSVSGDPGALAQALHEIAWQAMRATPEGGRIEIRLVRHDVNTCIAITDGRHRTPPGVVPAGTRRADGPPMDPLALRSVLERQGGRLDVEPATRAHGMRYLIELPLQPIAAPASPRAAAPRAARLTGLTALCIDDQADALEAIELTLRTEGARVVPFQRGSDAVAWLAQQPTERWPQLLACDISLGDQEEDGHGVMRRIRQIEAERAVPLAQRLPAIALTGHARPEDRLRALMAGFQLHLVKPVDADVLADTLAALAGRHRH